MGKGIQSESESEWVVTIAVKKIFRFWSNRVFWSPLASCHIYSEWTWGWPWSEREKFWLSCEGGFDPKKEDLKPKEERSAPEIERELVVSPWWLSSSHSPFYCCSPLSKVRLIMNHHSPPLFFFILASPHLHDTPNNSIWLRVCITWRNTDWRKCHLHWSSTSFNWDFLLGDQFKDLPLKKGLNSWQGQIWTSSAKS